MVEKGRPSTGLGRIVNLHPVGAEGLLTKIEFTNQGVVPVEVSRLEVIEQLATTVRQHDQTTTRVEVLAV